MTSPKHAQQVDDKGRWYTRPGTGEQLISVTNAIGVGVSKPALVPWAAKTANDKAWQLIPQMIHAARDKADCRPPSRDRHGWVPCDRCWGCLTRAIKGEHKVVADKASDLGTRIHALAEAHLVGKQMPDDPEAEPYLEQYLRFLADFDVQLDRDVEAAELTIADPATGYAGTADSFMRLPVTPVLSGKARLLTDDTRHLHVVDIKTSATRARTSTYPEYTLQLAGLRYAREAWLPNDDIVPIPKAVAAAVLNLRQKSYALIPVAADKRAYDAFRATVRTAQWLYGNRNQAHPPIDVPRDEKAVA